MKSETESMGERLRQLRKQRKISREWLAAMLKCDPISVECWEDGIMRPKQVWIEKLAAFYGVTLEYLMEGM